MRILTLVVILAGCQPRASQPADATDEDPNWRPILNQPYGEIPPHDPLVKARSAAFSPDNKLLLVGFAPNRCGGYLELYDVTEGRFLRRFPAHSGWVNFVAFLPDGQQALSSGHDDTFTVWDVRRGRAVGTLGLHKPSVHYGSLSADGQRLLSRGDDGWKLWHVASGGVLGRGPIDPVLRGTGPSLLSPDARQAVGIGPDVIGVWSMPDGKEIGAFQGPRPQGNPECFSRDGKRAISIYNAGPIAKPFPFMLWDVASGKEIRRFPGHFIGVKAVALTADGKAVVSAGGDGTLKRWEIITGREVWSVPVGDSPRCCAFSNDGTLAFSAVGEEEPRGKKMTLCVWDAGSGKLLHTLLAPKRW